MTPEVHVIDYNLLIKCATILLIVAAVVLVIFKSKWKGIRLKTKYGDVELEQNGSNIVTNKEQVSTIKQKYGYNEETLDRELKRIIGKMNTSITKNLLSFIIKNDLHLKSNTAMERYIDDKIIWLEKEYNTELSYSEPLKQFKINTILGDEEPVVRSIIRTGYITIYNNHKEAHDKFQELLKVYKDKECSQEFLDKVLTISRETNVFDVNEIEKTFKSVNQLIKKGFKTNILN